MDPDTNQADAPSYNQKIMAMSRWGFAFRYGAFRIGLPTASCLVLLISWNRGFILHLSLVIFLAIPFFFLLVYGLIIFRFIHWPHSPKKKDATLQQALKEPIQLQNVCTWLCLLFFLLGFLGKHSELIEIDAIRAMMFISMSVVYGWSCFKRYKICREEAGWVDRPIKEQFRHLWLHCIIFIFWLILILVDINFGGYRDWN